MLNYIREITFTKAKFSAIRSYLPLGVIQSRPIVDQNNFVPVECIYVYSVVTVVWTHILLNIKL